MLDRLDFPLKLKCVPLYEVINVHHIDFRWQVTYSNVKTQTYCIGVCKTSVITTSHKHYRGARRVVASNTIWVLFHSLDRRVTSARLFHGAMEFAFTDAMEVSYGLSYMYAPRLRRVREVESGYVHPVQVVGVWNNVQLS